MQGEIEWLDPVACPAAEEETLDVGGEWPVLSRLARAIHWPWGQARPGRIALLPVALISLLTFGPSSPGPTTAGHRPVTDAPITWICTATGPAAADAAPAARDLRGSLLAEQMQRPSRGPGCGSRRH